MSAIARRIPLACAVLLALAPAVAGAKSPPAPDLGGVWLADPPFLMNVMQTQPSPFRPEAAAQFRAALVEVGSGAAAIDWCSPMKFSGYSYGIGADLELLVTPGRITMIADDVGLVRRIYTGSATGPDRPSSVVVSASGSSTGHWDGDVLVVQTDHLDPTARFPLPAPGAPVIGEGAKVTERLHLEGKDTLIVDIETVAVSCCN